MTTFQKAKHRSIPKGLTHDFCRKMQNFLLLFLNKMSLEVMFHYVFDKKKLFGVKKKFTAPKIAIFQRGSPMIFAKKSKNFLLFFLEQNEPRNSISRRSR